MKKENFIKIIAPIFIFAGSYSIYASGSYIKKQREPEVFSNRVNNIIKELPQNHIFGANHEDIKDLLQELGVIKAKEELNKELIFILSTNLVLFTFMIFLFMKEVKRYKKIKSSNH